MELLNNPKHVHSRESTGCSTHLIRRNRFQKSFRTSPHRMLEVDHLLRFVVHAQVELPQFVAHVAPWAADADGATWQHEEFSLLRENTYTGCSRGDTSGHYSLHACAWAENRAISTARASMVKRLRLPLSPRNILDCNRKSHRCPKIDMHGGRQTGE